MWYAKVIGGAVVRLVRLVRIIATPVPYAENYGLLLLFCKVVKSDYLGTPIYLGFDR